MSIKVAEMIPETISIESAKQVGDFVLRLSFDDGTVQTVDFKPFLSSSRHPDIRAYLEPARFAAFRVEYGVLVWGEFGLCFPIADLYQNRLMPIQRLSGSHETMKAPVSKLKDSDLQKAPQALMRAAEKARQLAEQTGTPFVTRKSAAIAGTLGDDFPDDITDDDLGTDAPRHDLD